MSPTMAVDTASALPPPMAVEFWDCVFVTLFALVCCPCTGAATSKKGISAHQLHRMLGITYKAAWFMAHRVRHAMKEGPLSLKLRGKVEVDETYIGGQQKNRSNAIRREGIVPHKTQVVALVSRSGRARSCWVFGRRSFGRRIPPPRRGPSRSPETSS